MGYREEWFKHHKPILGNKYMCVKCHKLFPKSEIDIDHRIPKRDGGTDQLSNLQPMCKHCNRSKRDRQSSAENIVTLVNATARGELKETVLGIGKQKAKDILGIKYKR